MSPMNTESKGEPGLAYTYSLHIAACIMCKVSNRLCLTFCLSVICLLRCLLACLLVCHLSAYLSNGSHGTMAEVPYK